MKTKILNSIFFFVVITLIYLCLIWFKFPTSKEEIIACVIFCSFGYAIWLLVTIVDLKTFIELQKKCEQRKKYKEGTEWQVCKHCKFFEEIPVLIYSPSKNTFADGVCHYKNKDVKPIVMDCKKDRCNYFQFKE